jgi:hypothetical protein
MAGAIRGIDVAVERLDVSVTTVPNDFPGVGRLAEWDATTIVLVQAQADYRVASRLPSGCLRSVSSPE